MPILKPNFNLKVSSCHELAVLLCNICPDASASLCPSRSPSSHATTMTATFHLRTLGNTTANNEIDSLEFTLLNASTAGHTPLNY